jgi:hypothetical protein
VFPFILFRVENRVCLSRGIQVACATWRDAMRIVVGVEDLVQRTTDGQAQVGYLVAEQSEGQVTSCAWSTGFLVEPQNQGRQVS